MAFLELFSKSTLKHTKYKTPTQKNGSFSVPLILQGLDGLRMYFYTGFTRFEKTGF